MALVGAKLRFQLAAVSHNSAPFSSPKSTKPFPKSDRRRSSSFRRVSSSLTEERELAFTEPESRLVEALVGIQGRGRDATRQQLKEVEVAVEALEAIKGVPDPTNTDLIEGRWQLVFTTRPGTASPIQRAFVGVDFFKIFQEVYLRTDDPRVSNIVKFSNAIGELIVEAAATIKDGKRILFRFDRAAFSFRFLPFKVPYPVPFRLLGDEAKGWLDTTYLSHTGNIRISRGNKGTTFVLQKMTEPRQRLLSAIAVGVGIRQAVDELISLYQTAVDKEPETLAGEWQLLWASQSREESWLSMVANGLKGLQIVGRGGQLENQVEIFPSFRFQAIGNVIELPDGRGYSVTIESGAVLIGGLKLPLDIKNKFTMELLYIDSKIRITRGSNGITFVHLKVVNKPKST